MTPSASSETAPSRERSVTTSSADPSLGVGWPRRLSATPRLPCPCGAERELFATGLTAPEGLRFSPEGGFPLYVAEEDLGTGRGRISTIDAEGQHVPLCSGFLTIEDVALDAEGTLYVSEDGSGTVIAVERVEVAVLWGAYLPLIFRLT